MDELKPLSLTFGTGWRLGVLVSAGWMIGAAIERSSIMALLAMPALIGLWMFAILAIARWARRDMRTH
jgi:uncharacterized membrane protein YedE/YeeE